MTGSDEADFIIPSKEAATAANQDLRHRVGLAQG